LLQEAVKKCIKHPWDVRDFGGCAIQGVYCVAFHLFCEGRHHVPPPFFRFDVQARTYSQAELEHYTVSDMPNLSPYKSYLRVVIYESHNWDRRYSESVSHLGQLFEDLDDPQCFDKMAGRILRHENVKKALMYRGRL